MPSITHADHSHSVVCTLAPHALKPSSHCLSHRWRQVLCIAVSLFWQIYYLVLSGDTGVRIIHRSTDFYIVIKI